MSSFNSGRAGEEDEGHGGEPNERRFGDPRGPRSGPGRGGLPPFAGPGTREPYSLSEPL